MAFFAASSGSEAGFAAFDRVSQRSAKYDAAIRRDAGSTSASPRHDRLGPGTLIYEARQIDPTFRLRSRQAPRPGVASATSNADAADEDAAGPDEDAAGPDEQAPEWRTRLIRNDKGSAARLHRQRRPHPALRPGLHRPAALRRALPGVVRARSALATEAPPGARGRRSTTSSSPTGASCGASSSSPRPALQQSRWSRPTTVTTRSASILRVCAGMARLASIGGSRPISAPGSTRRRSMAGCPSTT